MVRFELKPTKSTAYEHTKRVYGAMFAEHGVMPESVSLYGGSVTETNTDGLVRMVQIAKECAIHIDCDDGSLYVQRFIDGSIQVKSGTDFYTVEVVE